jgi:YlmC/YmxH family sporulation protein
MDGRFCELQKKEIVNIRDGNKIGYPDDILFDLQSAQIKALVVCGRLRWFGLMGRQPDLQIPWCDIEIIGEDTILVRADQLPKEASKPRWWTKFFRE